MKRLISAIFLITVLLLGMVSCKKGSSEKLLMCGSGWNKIAIIDKETKHIEWEYPVEEGWECNSVDATPDGNVLFSYSKGAKLVDRNQNEIWNIPAPEHCEMQTARVMPDGNFLLAWCGTPAVIMEVDPKGNILKKIEYETGIPGSHSQFRQVNKNSEGNYLMPIFATSEIREISPEGETIKITKLEGTPFTTLAEKNGYYWIAGGDGHSLIEYDFENNNVVQHYGEKDIKGVRLFFVAGLAQTAEGNLYVCNWQGHARNAQDLQIPQLIEIDADGKIIWELNDNENFSRISDVCEIH